MAAKLVLPWLLFVVPLLIAPVHGQCRVDEVQRLEASDRDNLDAYGTAVALQGERAAIGAFRGEAAYVVEQDVSGTWVEQQIISASDGIGGDQFGGSVALDDDLLVVGAPGRDLFRGGAYVYRFNGTDWQEEQVLVASDAGTEDYFGIAVAVDDGCILVGASGWDVDPFTQFEVGAVYRFEWDGNTWSEVDQWVPSDPQSLAYFGESLALEGSRALVGAPGQDTQGSVFVFENSGGWSEVDEFQAADGAKEDDFGQSVDLDGDRAAVGAPWKDGLGIGDGAAYVFAFDGSNWSQEQRLIPLITEADAKLGSDVALDGCRILVGASLSSHADDKIGAVFVFHDHSSGWRASAVPIASDGGFLDAHGSAVALDGTTALSGAPGRDDTHGAVFAHDITPLGLEVRPRTAQAGDLVTVCTSGGDSGRLHLLAVIALDGNPFFDLLSIARFESDGTRTFTATVPPGLGALDIEMMSFGLVAAGTIAASNPAGVELQ